MKWIIKPELPKKGEKVPQTNGVYFPKRVQVDTREDREKLVASDDAEEDEEVNPMYQMIMAENAEDKQQAVSIKKEVENEEKKAKANKFFF